MTDENKNTAQAEENSGNPAEQNGEAAAQEVSAETNDQGAQNENGNEEQKTEEVAGIPPELMDKYKEFQRDYTEKTTKLADERKSFESEKEVLHRKASTLEKLISDPRFQSWYNAEVEKERNPQKEEQKKEEFPPLTDEIISDPKALQDYLVKRDEFTRRQYDERIASVENKMATSQLANDIVEYGNEKGNEDFWKLKEAGLIRDQDVVALAQKYPKASNIEILQAVHKNARDTYTKIVENATTTYKKQEQEEIQRKKNASIDSGRSSTPSSTPAVGSSFEDIMRKEAQKMGIPW